MNVLNYLYSSRSFKYLRVFFFPRLTYNLFFVLDYLIVFLSHSNILLGRGGEGTPSYRDLLSLERDVRLSLSYKVVIALTLKS